MTYEHSADPFTSKSQPPSAVEAGFTESAEMDAYYQHLISGQTAGQILMARLAAEELEVMATQLNATQTELDVVTEKSTFDHLTGLRNRAYAEQKLGDAVQRARRPRPHDAPRGDTVAFIDADHFKLINDTHGHAAGDEVLKRIAGALKATTNRHGEVAARLSGDEFFALFSNTTPDDAATLLTLVNESLQSDSTLPISLSIGIAPVEATSVAEVLKAADDALYSAKEAGRAQVHIADAVDG
ncbi:MAG: hypothetical protein JWN38_842 [Candidatus Saccharibacteria bacterium]|nr:hypothetical protein [Candidatus Saccharibacteria bacterium]